MESQTDTISPQTADAEANMRRNLGLNGAGPSASNDPLKAARQAIRSQVTAREYTERQLAQAQTAIQDLRIKLRHVHQEREAAISAAQSAMAARDTAERNMRAAGTALATERANRTRTEETLRDAEATIRDLREKLASANKNFHGVQAELDVEREAHLVADDDIIRPAVSEAASIVAPIRDATVPVVRRPVGRPRKIMIASSVGNSIRSPEKHKNTTKDGSKKTSQHADDQEPVQWWVEGWK